jgi:type IV secretion system protein VirD4
MPSTTFNYGSARWADFYDRNDASVLEREQLTLLDECEQNAFGSLENKRDYYKSEEGKKRKSFLLGRLEVPESLKNFLATGEMPRHKIPQYLGWCGDGHLITIAPTRSGKGVGVVIPNLLNYPGSVVVVDPKGENYAVTAGFRANMLGQKVVCLDPFGVTGRGTDVLNPFEILRTDNPDLLDDAGAIAEAMIIRSKEQKEPHWDDKATSVIKTFLIAVAFGAARTTDLNALREMLTKSESDFFGVLIPNMMNRTDILNGTLSRGASEIMSMSDTEWKSVLSSVQKHTEFLESARAQSTLSGQSTYNIMDMKTRCNVSVYIVIPPHYMSQYSRLIRLWLTMFMMAMTKVDGPPADGCPVLFMLDEIAQLGRLEALLRAVSLLGGYGAAFWMIWQDLAQIKGLYPDEWSSFLANAKIQQFFGINDPETAGYLSEMLGNETIQTNTYNITQADATAEFAKRGSTTAFAEKERALLTKDEIRRLNREMPVILAQGCIPVLTRRFTYYEDDEFRGRFAANPWHT